MTSLPNGFYDLAPGRLAAIVTFLERTEGLDGAPTAVPDGVEVAVVERPPSDWYRALFRRVGEPWLWSDRLRLTDPELRALLGRPGHRVIALRRDGEDIGFAELEPSFAGSVEIVYFGLVAGATGAGLGRALMRAALAAAFRPGVERVWLHTCNHDDPRALGFYARMGFRVYDQKIEVGDDPRLTGLLPRAAAAHIPIHG